MTDSKPSVRSLADLQALCGSVLGADCVHQEVALNELTLFLQPASYLEAMRKLRDTPGLQFDQLIDLCAVDYRDYKEGAPHRYMDMPRFCVVVHLLSVALNQRVRVKVFLANEDFPVVHSVTGLWSSANWFEREAFDLFGVVFDGHPDLRRILTDYGFIGHPMRKDFPLCGHVEMRYDAQAKRIIYQPVTIEMREQTPRIVREEGFGLRR